MIHHQVILRIPLTILNVNVHNSLIKTRKPLNSVEVNVGHQKYVLHNKNGIITIKWKIDKNNVRLKSGQSGNVHLIQFNKNNYLDDYRTATKIMSYIS